MQTEEQERPNRMYSISHKDSWYQRKDKDSGASCLMLNRADSLIQCPLTTTWYIHELLSCPKSGVKENKRSVNVCKEQSKAAREIGKNLEGKAEDANQTARPQSKEKGDIKRLTTSDVSHRRDTVCTSGESWICSFRNLGNDV